MGKSFTRALRHLKTNHKTTKLDEKKEMLNEIPTMHTGGVYSKNPPGFRYDPPSPAKRFIPDVDGNWPAGVPGTPGATEYIRPQGYWVNDSDWETKFRPDTSNDSILESPTNTDGFIDAQSGTVKTLLPPNSRSFILGPLVDGYNYVHGYDDYTNIGYIQKDTRQFVLLAQIQGHWNTNPITQAGVARTPRLWDGTSGQFTAYNSNFTLAMAQWFKDRITANDFTKDFPYFYSGGVFQPPLDPQPPGSPGGMDGGNAAGTGGDGKGPGEGEGKDAVGKGGTPDIGDETPQGDPEGGDAESQGYPAWGSETPPPTKPKREDFPSGRNGQGAYNRAKREYEKKKKKWESSQGGGSKPKPSSDRPKPSSDRKKPDYEKNRERQRKNRERSRERSREDKSAPKPSSDRKKPDYEKNRERQRQQRERQRNRRETEKKEQRRFKEREKSKAREEKDYERNRRNRKPPVDSESDIENDILGNDPKYKTNRENNRPPMKSSFVDDFKKFWKDQLSPTGYTRMVWDTIRAIPTSASTLIDYLDNNNPNHPNYRKNDPTSPNYEGPLEVKADAGWKNDIGDQLKNSLPDQSDYDMGGETGDTWKERLDKSSDGKVELTDWEIQNLSDTMYPGNDGGGDMRFHTLFNSLPPGSTNVTIDKDGNIEIESNYRFTDRDDVSSGGPLVQAWVTNRMKSDKGVIDKKTVFPFKDKEGGKTIGSTHDINIKLKLNMNGGNSSNMRTKKGNYKQTFIPFDYKPEGTLLREDKKRILREITQPLKEIKELPKTQKLEKYRPNFAGKYKPQNTPNVTASKKSDEMVKAKNAAGQTWRTKDKYWGGYESQERMNVVYDNVGHGSEYFNRIVNENLSKKNIKNRQVQEHLNIIAHEKAMRQLDSNFVSPFRSIEEQETYDNKVKDPLFSKVSDRLNKEINYEKKPSPKGYPNEAPPKIDPNTGMHPKYGQRYKYDKLDPQSAEAMPVQGNPEIDANVQKALDKRAKNRKIKNLKIDAPTVENFNWKETLKEKKLEESKKGFKKFKQDLKEGMTTGSIMTLSTPPQGDGTVAIDSVDPLDNTSYAVVTDLFSVGDNLAANTGTTVRSSGSGSGTDGGFNVGGDYLAFQGVGTNDASNTRWAALSPMDSSAVDTITITAIVGNDTNGGEDPDAAGEGLVVMYKKPGMAQARFLNTDPQGVQRGTATSDIIIPLGSSSNSGLNSYSVEVPEYARAKDTQFVLIQPTNSGSEYDHYGITEIKVQRRAPVNVVVPLSDPAAISFINVGTTEGDPKKRKKKVQDQLDASDEYVTSQFGDDFPTGARLTSDDEIEASPIGINQVRDRFSPSKGEDSSTYVRGASTAQSLPPSSQATMEPKDDNGEPIPVKPIGRGIAVQGADAANLDAQEPEPTDPQPSDPQPSDPMDMPEPEDLPDDEKEELKNQGKTPEEIKQTEELKKEQEKLDKITDELIKRNDYLAHDVAGINEIFANITWLIGAFNDYLNPIAWGMRAFGIDFNSGKLVNNLNIARSHFTGKVENHIPNHREIKEFTNSLIPTIFDTDSPSYIPISDVRHPYADDNIKVDLNGKVSINYGTHQGLADKAYAALGDHGKGYAQLIIPQDGGRPYVHYYDYNYHNLNSPETGEVPNVEQEILSALTHLLGEMGAVKSLLTIPFIGALKKSIFNYEQVFDSLKNKSGLEGWPPGIHGAALTDFKVDIKNLPKETQEMIAAHPLSWTPERVANMSQEEINEQMSTVFKTEADYEDYFEYTQDITRMTTEPVNTVPYAVAMQEYIKLADQYENVQLEKYGEGGWEKFSKGLASENPSEFFASERASREDRDTILSLIEQIDEKRDSAISDEKLMKEIPDPEGERPELDWDSDPDSVKYDNLWKEASDKYMNYYDNEYKSAWNAYESYAKSNLTLKDGYWVGPKSKIDRLGELAEDVLVVQKELDRLSDDKEKQFDLSTKANTVYLEKYLKAVKPWEDAQEKRNEKRNEIFNQYTKFVNELREINKPIWDYNSAQTFRTISGKDRYGDARWKVGGASWTASPEVAGGSYTSLKFSSIEKIVNEVFSDDKSRIKELRSKLNGTVYRGKNYYFDEYYNAEDEFIDEANALYEPVEYLQKYVDGNYVREVKIKEFGEKYKLVPGESWSPKKGSGRRSDPKPPDSDLGSTGGYVGGDATAAATAASERRRRNNNKNESTLYKKVIGKTLLKT